MSQQRQRAFVCTRSSEKRSLLYKEKPQLPARMNVLLPGKRGLSQIDREDAGTRAGGQRPAPRPLYLSLQLRVRTPGPRCHGPRAAVPAFDTWWRPSAGKPFPPPLEPVPLSNPKEPGPDAHTHTRSPEQGCSESGRLSGKLFQCGDL